MLCRNSTCNYISQGLIFCTIVCLSHCPRRVNKIRRLRSRDLDPPRPVTTAFMCPTVILSFGETLAPTALGPYSSSPRLFFPWYSVHTLVLLHHAPLSPSSLLLSNLHIDLAARLLPLFCFHFYPYLTISRSFLSSINPFYLSFNRHCTSNHSIVHHYHQQQSIHQQIPPTLLRSKFKVRRAIRTMGC